MTPTRVGQIRGVLAERVAVSVSLDPFLSLKAASGYLGLSVKTLRRAVNDIPDRALPCYRVGTAILVRRSEADAWMAQRRILGRPSLVAAMRALGLAREGAPRDAP
jgi:excisionase family DNA binding protein